MSDATPPDRLPEQLPADPMLMAESWLDEATSREVQRNPNAMTLVTLGADQRPSARIVLCKSFIADPGYVVFYTNYQSRKGRDIAANPNVALVFHWDALGRQVRIEGKAVFSPPAESDEYFQSRDWGSRLGAWGSDQSRPVASRDALIAQIRARATELGLPLEPDAGNPAAGSLPEIPRPPHWGGFRVWASSVELWIEGRDRIHDRALWTRELEPSGEHEFAPSDWVGTRLQP